MQRTVWPHCSDAAAEKGIIEDNNDALGVGTINRTAPIVAARANDVELTSVVHTVATNR